MSWKVIEGDVNEFLPWLDSNSMDAVLTDPPYGLEFMGKDWDAPWRKNWQAGGGFSKPGIGEREIPWPSFSATGRFASANPTCGKCGGRARGARKCSCVTPEWNPIGKRRNPENEGLPDDVTTSGKARQMAGYQAWVESWALELYRVLKPGAHLLAFGGPRTEHRLACAIEDTGFEIRNKFCWLFGSGMPKSLDLSKALDKMAGAERTVVERIRTKGGGTEYINRTNATTHGYRTGEYQKGENILDITAPATPAAKLWSGYGTGIKPSYESVILAMKPCEGTYSQNALRWKVAGLNIDGCRVETADNLNGGAYSEAGRSGPMPGDGRSGKALGMFDPGAAPDRGYVQPSGRWPANLILGCACDGEHEPDCPVRMLDEQTGDVSPGTMGARHTGKHDNLKYGYGEYDRGPGYGDRGGPSRFFYVSKSSTSERERGLIGHLPCTTCGDLNTTHHLNDKGEQIPCRRNDHPTQKPLKLCEYLSRLLLPPKRDTPRRILVPFAGTGSEMLGALKAGWDEVIGIEIDHHYCRIAEARLAEYKEK